MPPKKKTAEKTTKKPIPVPNGPDQLGETTGNQRKPEVIHTEPVEERIVLEEEEKIMVRVEIYIIPR